MGWFSGENMPNRQFSLVATLTSMASSQGGGYLRRMWWKKKTEPPMRDQLLEARAKLTRQIEVLGAGPASLGRGGEFIDNAEALSELRDVLAQIDEGLRNVGPDDS